MTDWTRYGQLNSPFESLGYERELYAEKKKKEIFTDSRAYYALLSVKIIAFEKSSLFI